MNENTKKIFEKYISKMIDDSIFFYPNIPQSKLRNAIQRYAIKVDENDVIVLIDNTVFGSAKDGALLTYTALHTHNIYDNPQQVDLVSIVNLTLAEGVMESILYVNDNPLLKLNIPKKPAIRLFAEMLREIIDSIRFNHIESQPTNDIVESLQQLKLLFDSDLITKEEYDEKRKRYLVNL